MAILNDFVTYWVINNCFEVFNGLFCCFDRSSLLDANQKRFRQTKKGLDKSKKRFRQTRKRFVQIKKRFEYNLFDYLTTKIRLSETFFGWCKPKKKGQYLFEDIDL